MRRPRSLRGGITLAVLALVALGLVVSGAAGVLLLHRALVQEVDHRLRGLAAAEAPPRSDGFPPEEAGHRPPPLPTDLRSLSVSADGEVTRSSGQSSGDEGLPDVSGVGAEGLRERAGVPFTLPDTGGGDDWRVLATAREDGGAAVVAQSLGGVGTTVRTLVLIEVSVGAVILTALGVGATAVVHRRLRPLREMEETARAIAGGDLDRRVPRDGAAAEVDRVGEALNTMLGELSRALAERDRSAATTRRFVADASHELRTPLSSIRGFAELYRQGRDRGVVAGDERGDGWVARIEGEAERMGALVDDLLVLSRFDEEPALERADVELGAIAREVAAAVSARAPRAPVRVEAAVPVRAVGDPGRLRQVLENLVGNAVAHTPEGTPVLVRVDRGPVPEGGAPARAGELPPEVAEVAVVTVADEGPGIAAADLPFVFDRFYRAPGPRGPGAGLGLAIVAALVGAHQGVVTADSGPEGGTVFTVLLPLG
ncbi:sensor histidine kinase [Nocardiopsis changdeensis]|uniref:histidine kinase n=1 Tax=Nocardiopsis changdeensis TaxID=2831969 RepID=A0ABX8BS68_9ACTN|nr:MULTISPECIES: HAMP domain-containing sensor histidine kinase [Nocardiopsis]QUX24867.1 HAMP domain-containing histidine kinase [Nocardiopsis changdeensis]QYX35253.1 HAMP domain-containing histidine kinase [Nocardiopsis sp. MT53]